MKVSIEEIGKTQEEEIIIRCHEVDKDILKLVKQIKNSEHILLGYEGDSIHRIRYSAIYYIEAVDSKVFYIHQMKSAKSRWQFGKLFTLSFWRLYY